MNTWISVEDRLPDGPRNVLTNYGDLAYYRYNSWFSVTALDWPGKVIMGQVTHWMELPKFGAPAVAENAGIPATPEKCERCQDLDACLRSAVEELLQATGESGTVDEWISTWFDATYEHAHQYDHIGR